MSLETSALRSALPVLQGEFYIDVLRRFHEVLNPKTYFEIGCYEGVSLALSRARTLAVDPDFSKLCNVIGQKPTLHMMQMTSDAFFREYRAHEILKDAVEFAFLDGMHLFEYLLRDFMNIENSCNRNSIIVMHDCLPIDVHITTRENDRESRAHSTQPDWWTGDVWKIVPVLQKYRPELQIVVMDAPPTGLVMVTNLDPSSHVLADNYARICAEYANLDLIDYGIERLFAEARIRSTREFVRHEQISRTFWL